MNIKKFNPDDFAFEVSIPSALLFNEKLDFPALKLYAMIKGLSRAHGYCFATNEYLAINMDIGISSIKKWIKQLKDEGFLEIHTDKTGIHWQRKIFVGMGLKKSLRRSPPRPPLAKTTATPSRQGDHYKEEVANKDVEDKKEKVEKEDGKAKPPQTPPPQEVAPPISKQAQEKEARKAFGSHVALTDKEFQELESKKGRDALLRTIEEINDYCLATGKKYKDYSAAIRNWFRREEKYQKRSGNFAKEKNRNMYPDKPNPYAKAFGE